LARLKATEAALVTFIRRTRGHRNALFGADLFGEPAWDILLDLYAAELRQERAPISAVCIGAGVPQTTAARWIRALEEKGLLSRSLDPLDRRRTFLSLTDLARSKLDGLFTVLQDELSLVQPRR
jgi:DNA-binding MarR family transcriptional regulator